jgi:hypothetical protein
MADTERRAKQQTFPEDYKDLSYIPLETLTTPRNGECIVKQWWIVHPERGAVVYSGWSIQCNPREDFARRVLNIFPWAEVKYVEVAFLGPELTRRRRSS